MKRFQFATMLFGFLFSLLPVSLSAQSNGVCQGFISGLSIGVSARVLPGDPNNIRTNPSTSARRIGQIPAGAALDVIDGPTCANGYTWWYVRYNGITGWTVEGSASERWLEGVTGGGTTQSQASGQGGDSNIDLLRALAYGAGGGGGPELCGINDSDGEFHIVARFRDFDEQAHSTTNDVVLQQLQNNSTFTVSYLLKPFEAMSSETYVEVGPAICFTTRASSAIAISPSGSKFAVDEQEVFVGNTIYQYALPFEAYAQPGKWTLRADKLQIYVNVAIATPGMIMDRSRRYIIGAGFAPNERVVLLPEYEAFETDPLSRALVINTNRNGYFYSDISQGQSMAMGLSALVGESGDVLTEPINNFDCFVPMSELEDKLYRTVWKGEATTVNCANDF